MQKRYKGLCISSGGYKGFGVMGALAHFEREGYLKDIRRFAGCSIGAVINTLLVCGWSSIELYKRSITVKLFYGMESVDVSKFKDNYGLISNDLIRVELETMIIEKMTRIPTLLELYNRGYYIAYAVCDKTNRTGKKLDYKSHPTLKCSDAALMSSNIPILFSPIIFDGMAIVDGALTNPFPLDFIDNGDDDVLGIVVYSKVEAEKTILDYLSVIIGIQIEERQRISAKNATSKVDILEMHVLDLSYVQSTHSWKIKNKMFFHGWRDASYFITALKRYQRKEERKRRRDRKFEHNANLKALKRESNIEYCEFLKDPASKIDSYKKSTSNRVYVKMPMKTVPQDIILKCLMSQPMDILCQVSLNTPQTINKSLTLLKAKVVERYKVFARTIIEDEIKSGIHVRVEEPVESSKTDGEDIKIGENYSQKLYDNMPPHIQETAKIFMNTMTPKQASTTMTGINIIIEGLRHLGIDIFQGFLLADRPADQSYRTFSTPGPKIEEIFDDESVDGFTKTPGYEDCD